MRFKQHINEKIETKEFRDMVKEAIEDIYLQSEKINKVNGLIRLIKKNLKPVFKEVISEVIGDKDSSIKVLIKKVKEGIKGRCAYEKRKNHFELEIDIGEDLLSAAIYNNKAKRKDLLMSVQEVAVHEVTHLIQGQRGLKGTRPYYNTKKVNLDFNEKYKRYLSLPEEIEAYATSAAESLIEQFGNDITISQIEEMLQDKNKIVKLEKLNDTIKDYGDLFGKHQEENNNSRKIGRRFVKKLIEHLEEMK